MATVLRKGGGGRGSDEAWQPCCHSGCARRHNKSPLGVSPPSKRTAFISLPALPRSFHCPRLPHLRSRCVHVCGWGRRADRRHHVIRPKAGVGAALPGVRLPLSLQPLLVLKQRQDGLGPADWGGGKGWGGLADPLL
jgi:hypothetical protein